MQAQRIDLSHRTSVAPMQFHGPGWGLEAGPHTFQLWAPQDGTVPDPFHYSEQQIAYNPDWQPRDHWAASWHERLPEDDELGEGDDPHPFRSGGFWKGESAAEVLANFPPEVTRLFESVPLLRPTPAGRRELRRTGIKRKGRR